METQTQEVIVNITPPNNIVRNTNRTRLSDIFFRLSITCIVLNIFALLSSFISPILYLTALVVLLVAGLCISIFTLGTVYLVPDNIAYKIWELLNQLLNSGELISNITAICFNATKWISIVGIATSVASIIFTAMTKNYGKAGKITGLSFVTILFGVVLAFQLLTGGMQW